MSESLAMERCFSRTISKVPIDTLEVSNYHPSDLHQVNMAACFQPRFLCTISGTSDFSVLVESLHLRPTALKWLKVRLHQGSAIPPRKATEQVTGIPIPVRLHKIQPHDSSSFLSS